MKLNKVNKISAALALSLGLTAAANAQVIYVTGSTAFRNQVEAALHTDMGLAIDNGTGINANTITFSGTVSNPNSITGITTTGLGAVTVECSFQGSAEGVNSIIGASTPGYLTSTGAADTCTYGADIAFSDCAAATTSYAAGAAAANGGSGLTEVSSPTCPVTLTGVAIQPFGWFANKAAQTVGVNNMSPQLANALFSSGTLGLNFWTGVATDSNTVVYAVGRTNDSGTRVTALVDININFNQNLNQNVLTNGATGNLSTVIKKGSAGFWSPVGNNGFASGGNVAYEIGNDTVTQPAVGYIGLADAYNNLYLNGSGVATGTAVTGAMAYDGTSVGTFAEGFNLTAIENGSYVFWGYEHEYTSQAGGSPSTATALGADIAAGLDYEIHHPVAPSIQTALGFEDMNVYRNADGGVVFHN